MGKCEFDKDMHKLYTVETRIKEPTFLGDSLLKDLICCLNNPYIRDGGSVSLIENAQIVYL